MFSVSLGVSGLFAALLVGFAKNPRASAGAGVLRGTASYRERVALEKDRKTS